MKLKPIRQIWQNATLLEFYAQAEPLFIWTAGIPRGRGAPEKQELKTSCAHAIGNNEVVFSMAQLDVY
jgi:hypothetical protein